MLPYHDENETERPAYAAAALIGLSVLTWVLIQGAGARMPLASSVCSLGLIPGALTGSLPQGAHFRIDADLICAVEPDRQLANVLSSMFLHGSWMHLLGNMWFLWLFGNNVEDVMTRPRFLVFYVVCGVAATLLQVATAPSSAVPMVGASGAISGVMGAYLVLFPRVRVLTLVPIGLFLTTIALPAWAMLVYWAFLQIAGGLMRSGVDTGGVAFWAHVGGFVAGVTLVKLFVRRDYLIGHRARPSRRRQVES